MESILVSSSAEDDLLFAMSSLMAAIHIDRSAAQEAPSSKIALPVVDVR